MTEDACPEMKAALPTRQEELAALAKKSFDGGLTPEEVERVKELVAEAKEVQSFEPPAEPEELETIQDEVTNRLMNPGSGIGVYDAMLVHVEKPKLPPEEAIPALFAKMKPYRKFLIAILNACREEVATESVDAAVKPEYEFCSCVYSPIALRKMLVEAGALEYLEPELLDDGVENADSVVEDNDDKAEVDEALSLVENVLDSEEITESPVTVDDEDEDIDERNYAPENAEDDADREDETPVTRGSVYDQENYLVIEDEPEGTWLTSAAGLAYLESINPEKQFSEQLEQHADVTDVFYDVLAFCAEEPRNITDIVKHFEDDPRLGPDTFYASFVVDRLEEIGAMTWKKNWVLTELGQKFLAERGME